MDHPASSPADVVATPDAPAQETLTTECEPVIYLPPEQWPNVDHLITEDDTPVDNFFSAKQQRLLVEPLYSSWPGPGDERSFLADANVGVFAIIQNPAIVPDMFLSLDVEPSTDWWEKRGRSYLLWELGKAPDVVIEIVSNREGNETGSKLQDYARMAVPYYVIFDPAEHLHTGILHVYELAIGRRTYQELSDGWMAGVGLGVRLWDGVFEGRATRWLRWYDAQGHLIPTGAERAEQERQRAEQSELAREQERQRAEQERQRAEQERQRAEQSELAREQERQRAEQERQRAEQSELAREQERQRAEQERQRAEQLLAQLRALGIEPDLK